MKSNSIDVDPGETVKNVAALVLAAGQSRRMGPTNKLTVSIEGTPMVARVVDALIQSKVNVVVVVTGFAADEIRATLSSRDVEFVHNPDYEAGMGSSIRAGIAALADDVDAALVALGDMPWVRSHVIDQLVDAFSPGDHQSIHVPVFNGAHGNPVLWGSGHFARLRALSGDVGGRKLLPHYREAIRYIDVNDSGVTIDFDTPDTLDRPADGSGT